MSHTPGAPGTEAAPKSLIARFVGVIVSPAETFRSVVAHPHWLGMLVLVCVGMAALVGGYLSTRVGQQAWLDAATTNPFSGPVSAEQHAAMEKVAPYAGYIAIAQMLLMTPLVLLAASGILFAVFNAALGGAATFKQLFSVVVHSSAVSLVGQLYTMPINYARGTLSSATNLGVLLPMVDETSFFGRLAGMVDLFLLWWLLVLAIGLGVLYRRRTQPIALSLLAIYAVIAVVIAVVRSRMGGA
jgi:hypothetical protein